MHLSVHLNLHIGELGHAPVRASKSPHRRISPLPLKYDTSVSRLENELFQDCPLQMCYSPDVYLSRNQLYTKSNLHGNLIKNTE
jgi:hypothetical protein